MGIEAPSFGVRQAWARIWTPLSFNALKLAGVTLWVPFSHFSIGENGGWE